MECQTYLAEAGYQVLSVSIPEKIAYRRASDEGRALTETRFQSREFAIFAAVHNKSQTRVLFEAFELLTQKDQMTQ